MAETFATSLSFIGILCFLVSMLLWFYAPRTRKFNKILSVFYALLSFQCMVSVLLTTQWMIHVPHFYRTGFIAILLSTPLSYLYIRAAVTGRMPSKSDWLHFLPAFIFVVDFFPFFLLSGTEKVAFYESENVNRSMILFAESRFFPPGFYAAFKYVQALFYWIIQLVVIYKGVKGSRKTLTVKNKAWFRWILIFLFTEIFLFIPPFGILDIANANNPWVLGLFVGGGTGLASLFIFLFPRILYGLTQEAKAAEGHPYGEVFHSDPVRITQLLLYSIQRSPNGKVNEKTSYLQEEKMAEIAERIDQHFDTPERSFLNLHYTLQKLSQDLEIPYQYISSTFNDYKKIKFNDFLNKKRIDYCIDLLNAGDLKVHTLESIAQRSGFNNRNTFLKSFKKFMGQTPSEYIKTRIQT